MIRFARLPLLLATLLLAGCNGSTDTDPKPVQGQDDFSSNTVGRYDQAAVGTLGTWRISGGVLTATGPAIQNVFVRQNASFADGYVETVSSRADDGGLVLRFTAESSYYLLAFRDDAAPGPFGTSNLAIYRRFGERFEEIGRGNIDWPRGTPRTIRFGIAGGKLSVTVDGQLVGEVTDPDPLPAGRVGLRHYGDTAQWITTFDRFSWREVLQ
jgi:hypothetical protein